jgi:hypothetical protein
LVAVHRLEESIAPESAIWVGLHDWRYMLRQRLGLSLQLYRALNSPDAWAEISLLFVTFRYHI